jgi:hypothetical protein
MPVVRINNMFLPAVKQVATGSGSLQSVYSTVPDAFKHRADEAGGAAFPVEVTLYDGDPNNGGTPLTSINADNFNVSDYSPAITLPFTHGLYMKQTKGGEVSVSYTPN